MILGGKYKVLFLYEPEGQITEYTADKVYRALQSASKDKDKDKHPEILLVVHSRGGQIEPAYLISKCCREYSKRFVVCVPRKAKSAATLVCLGASEIHMGSMSELGPIDPQMGGFPALGLSNALKCLSQLVEASPGSAEMFAKYLEKQLPLPVLGYFERVTESAAQYAERLLVGRSDAKEIARRFVYEYKDHSFVIDREEAGKILGATIKTGTPEYRFGNLTHVVFENLNLLLGWKRQMRFSFVGVESGDMSIDEKPKEE